MKIYWYQCFLLCSRLHLLVLQTAFPPCIPTEIHPPQKLGNDHVASNIEAINTMITPDFLRDPKIMASLLKVLPKLVQSGCCQLPEGRYTVNQKGNDLDKSNDFKCYQTMVNHLLLCLNRYPVRYHVLKIVT